MNNKENELLALLCSHANEILQRDFALKTIWIDDNYFMRVHGRLYNKAAQAS